MWSCLHVWWGRGGLSLARNASSWEVGGGIGGFHQQFSRLLP